MADIEGVRSNQLIGYGLVVGLNRTGDRVDAYMGMPMHRGLGPHLRGTTANVNRNWEGVWDAAARGPWALEVAGLVRRPLRLTLEDLTRLPSVTQRVNHYCVEGWMAVTTFTGVRVSTLATDGKSMATSSISGVIASTDNTQSPRRAEAGRASAS